MRVIPTPQVFKQAENVKPICGFAKILCNVAEDETVAWGLQKLHEVAGGNGTETLTLQNGDEKFFEEKNAHEQGYILTRDANGIVLTAQTSIGILYGLMTLRQLCEEAPETFEVYDRPQIRFRGNMNTLWAELGVWSYDFGDGMENACRRVKEVIDQFALVKMNLMYADAFGFRTERFPGYDALMTELTAYARVRGVRFMVGGYTMGYGMSAHNNSYMGKVFRNRRPYPDGEIYDCIGTYDFVPNDTEFKLKGRSYGTCLSNDALTDDKIAELRDYLRATGTSVLYLHNMDADQIHEPLWRGRCDHCRALWPNDSLYAADGAAGAFAAFYDRILDALLPEFPDLLICPVSPGYAYADSANDQVFEQTCKFWSAIYALIRNKACCVPMFREHFYQHDEPVLRFDHMYETLPSYGVLYFSSGDGFYSDKVYSPSAAYAAFMKDADVVICANGTSLQKPAMVANGEYLWNPTHSAFWNVEFMGDYKEQFAHYNAFREGKIRPEGIYGEDGLLDASCELIFGKKHGKRIADVYRLRGKNAEGPVFYPCNADLWTNYTKVNFPMLWDTPAKPEHQSIFATRFCESAIVTGAAADILAEVLAAGDLTPATREHLQFLYDSAVLCRKLCSQLSRYMDLYMEADRFFADGTPYTQDLCARAEALQRDALATLETVKAKDLKAFDPLGGMMLRREEMFSFVAYCSGQIVKSIRTGKRVPDDRKPLNVRDWW